MSEFVDTHTHIFCSEFDCDRDAVVDRALSAGVVRMCLPCIEPDTLPALLGVCDRYPRNCFPMIGLHPTEVNENYIAHLQAMKNILETDSRIVAVGEVGLDFYWDTSFRSEQIEAFEAQIEWARDCRLPLAIHSRNAFDELAGIMDKYRSCGLTGVFHCFSGDANEAKTLLSHEGFYLGVGGVLTYKKSILPSVLAGVPLERIVLETDSPYLAPVPCRGKRNESANIPYIATALADVYGCSVEHIADVTTANAVCLFPKIRLR